MISLTNSYLESLHDLIMVWLISIMLCVMLVGLGIFISPYGSLVLDSRNLELIWTILPIIILISLAFPSIYLLCYQDSLKSGLELSMKIISRQWSWSSECIDETVDHLLDFESLENYSSMEVPMVFPEGVSRIILTSTDVLHSLGIPGMGIKLDSVPGRLNFTTLEIAFNMIYWASCFELCGSGHSAMPLTILSLCL